MLQKEHSFLAMKFGREKHEAISIVDKPRIHLLLKVEYAL